MQMNQMFRGIIASTVIGAAVGALMIVRRKKMSIPPMKMKFSPVQLVRKARKTVPIARDDAKRWTSVFRTGTKALTRRLARA